MLGANQERQQVQVAWSPIIKQGRGNDGLSNDVNSPPKQSPQRRGISSLSPNRVSPSPTPTLIHHQKLSATRLTPDDTPSFIAVHRTDSVRPFEEASEEKQLYPEEGAGRKKSVAKNLDALLLPTHTTTSKNRDNTRRRSTMDAALSKALDAMDFEYKQDIRKNKRRVSLSQDGETFEEQDFMNKEIKSNACWRQMLTLSTLICIGQIGILVYMILKHGMAPIQDNPNYGPTAYTLVAYGGRDAWAIKKRNQWYRLISPIFLHAGFIHLGTNVLIQLRVGGYLNMLYGNRDFLIIYLVSGIFGSLCSCNYLPNSVGVGSSGALLGILCSWLAWIVFRWQKIPEEARVKRNLQLVVVSIAIAGTLFFSFTPYVDWATHFGGAGMGGVLGCLLLSEELDSTASRWTVRVMSVIVILGAFLWAFWNLVFVLHPEPLFPPNY